jgi:glutathione synthase/RimK-type ligase-like ATP-grasp enzyme
MPSTVLIITNDHDEHASAVIDELHKRDVPVFRFHPEEFPHACSISMELEDGRIEGEIRNADRRVAFSDICAAWYRRSRNLFGEPPSMTSERLDQYVRAQSNATLTALCHSLQTLWVSHPYSLRRAEIKVLQLAYASKAGLNTPRTLMCNDPARAAAFVGALGETECAIKPLIAMGVTDEQGYRLPLTTTLPAGHALDSVSLAPNMFQPYIDKAFELRCVVIGDGIFCAKIDSQASETSRKDWRAGDWQGAELEQEVFLLPDHVQAAIHRLMNSFGINFASIDMIVTPSGEFVFLELNPNGQWLWLEIDLGMPLVASMADLLTTRHSRAGQAGAIEQVSVSQRVADYA